MTTTLNTPVVEAVDSMQRARAKALVSILAIRGLPEATWTIWPGDDMYENPGLQGTLSATSHTNAAEQLHFYAAGLGLTRNRDRAEGWYRGVRVQVVAVISRRDGR